MGQGYGFPSSHSQWMGYFAAFLLCHFNFRHRFLSTGWKPLDYLWRTALQVGIVTWAASVAYSRCVSNRSSPLLWLARSYCCCLSSNPKPQVLLDISHHTSSLLGICHWFSVWCYILHDRRGHSCQATIIGSRQSSRCDSSTFRDCLVQNSRQLVGMA